MRKWLYIIFLVLAGIGLSYGDEPLTPRTPKLFFDDGLYLYSSPFHLNRDNYKTPLVFGSIIVGSSLLDSTIRNHLVAWSDSTPARNLRKLGDFAQMSGPVVGTLVGIHGWAADNDKSKETAYLSYETFLWAGAIESTVKYVVGRERPFKTANSYSFIPFSGNYSFPSGHTTEAFAAATVFSEQYPHWYVYVPSYGIAASVGYSRLYANQHWFSDVVAGAIIGTSVSHILRKRHRHPKDYSWSLESNGSDIRLVKRF